MLDLALTEQDYKNLDDFLLSDESPEECMSIDELHGFLTAIVCGPRIMPSEWLPEIWGKEQKATFKSDVNATEILSIIVSGSQHRTQVWQHQPNPFYCW